MAPPTGSKPTDTVPAGLRLSRELYDRLKHSPLGVSGEIRRRLSESFARDVFAEENRGLGDLIAVFADVVKRETGANWNRNPAAAALLLKAIEVWIKRSAPEGAPVFTNLPKHSFLNASDSLDAMARQVAMASQSHFEQIQHLREINKHKLEIPSDQENDGEPL